MASNKYTLFIYIMVAVVTGLFVGCDSQTVYNHFEHTSMNGWERNDTLTFVTAPLTAGNYDELLALRISGDYPFLSVNLVVEQRAEPAQQVIRDTLVCDLIGKDGVVKGHGVSSYQYMFPLKRLHVPDSTTLHLTVRHDMKREMLPGITELGIVIKRADDDWRRGAGK